MRKIIFIIIILLTITISGCIEEEKYPYTRMYGGQEVHFRANLTESYKVPVYPDEKALTDVLLNPDLAAVHIAYFPNERENPHYLAAIFELGYKMTLVHIENYGLPRNIEDIPINSTEEIIATPEEPVILLYGPSKANQTAVTVDGNIIIVEGEGYYEKAKDYIDLDLATDKLLLVLMDYYERG